MATGHDIGHSRRQFILKIDDLIKLYVTIGQITTPGDSWRRYELVQIRKKIAVQIGIVGKAGDQLFAEHNDIETTRKFRTKFSLVCTKTAFHQANWPAFRLGESVTEYQQSVREVRNAIDDFIAWSRETAATIS